jgi:hypothetical protein
VVVAAAACVLAVLDDPHPATTIASIETIAGDASRRRACLAV